MTLLTTTLLIMTIRITLNTGDITYNGIAYDWIFSLMALLITVDKEHICKVVFIYVKSNYK
jgi:hypothetical protein